MRCPSCVVLGGFLSLSLLSCGSPGPGRVVLDPQVAGFSDVALLDSLSYLVVFDTKDFEDESRVGLLTLNRGSIGLLEGFVEVDWKDPRSRASDLEALCPVPDRPGQFLLLESGSWDGRPGRIFRVEVREGEFLVVGMTELPTLAPNGPGQSGDQYEGMACAGMEEAGTLVILGERGGSGAHPRGVLRWGSYDLETSEFRWLPGGEVGLEVSAPGEWRDEGHRRDITGLFLDEEETLWASAAVDGGDRGPFHSVVYALGAVDAGAPIPVQVNPDPVVGWDVGGHKIEGLAPVLPSASNGGLILVAWEDEELGGGVLVLEGEGRR